MSADLPNTEQSVSYVVDDGEPSGPFALTEIARSIAAGERKPDCYVWWVGAHEWIAFNSDARLMLLLPGSDVGVGAEAEMPEVPVESATDETPEVETAVSDVEAEPTEITLPAKIDVVEAEAEPVVVEPVVVEPATTAFHAAPVESTEDELVDDESVPDEPVEIDALETELVESIAEPEPVVIAEPEIDLTEEATPAVAEVIELDEISLSENSVLASVSARLEALTSSTRHYQSSMKLDAAEAISVDTIAAPDIPDIVIEPEPSGTRTSVFGGEFDAIVRRTAQYQRLAEQSERIRELLSRACAAVISQHGYSVERRTELRGHYFLNFEHGLDTRQMRIEITPAPSVSGDESQYVSLAMTWGRLAFDIDEALETLLGQPPMANAGPGVISVDADLDNGSVSTRVNLVLPVDAYIGADFAIDRESLQDALAAIQHALEQRWYELFIPAE